jgi:hypothetical protein
LRGATPEMKRKILNANFMVAFMFFLLKQLERFHLLEPSEYHYLCSGQTSDQDLDDVANFEETQVIINIEFYDLNLYLSRN